MLSNFSTRFLGGLLTLGLLIVSAGCGPNQKARGSVKGKVTIQGKHLTVGNIVFYGKQNISGSAAINKNGEYSLADAPLGDVSITIFVP
jgi:hypothetical protein